MFQCHGAPMVFSDKHSVFRVAKKDATGRQGMTPVQPCAFGAKHRDRMRSQRSYGGTPSRGHL